MAFKRSVQRYGTTPEPDTPYQRAGQLWDERIGSARVQARNWRIMALGGLLLSSGLAASQIWLSLQSRVIPYVVEVDRLGEARSVRPADSSYRPTDPQIAWHLAAFVRNIRSVSLDPVLMRENWLAAYDFTTKQGAIRLSEHARADDPFADVGIRTVSVQVTSIVRASDRSFQVKWTESEYERGSLTAESRWTAMLTVIVRPPRSADAIRKNPLGLYVDAIDWSRELEPPPRREPRSTAPAPAPRIPSDIPHGSPLDPGLSGELPILSDPERNIG
ncbi:type IV secretion system protein VirB5 [Sphingomonas laterariae]|uniref:Type IV secretion system protein VirB5 n=1 Tax=Edaphosphingomonas laterariae TaxID=861865 RepID=A0A239J0D2_9SPHN|nr:conjugal transfer protein TrbF [Sphingomonas laterariae]SNS99327.1 type IV secretion system protein VirB5 [Sphingomonas laterariae]